MKSSALAATSNSKYRMLISAMLAPLALVAMVASSFALWTSGASAQLTPHASSSAPCNATVTTGTGVVVGTYIVGVTPGKTQITLDCNASVTPGFAVEASLLSAVGTNNVILQNGVDTAALGTFSASSNDTGCPAGTAGSCSVSVFSVPSSFTASDSNAVCSPTQAQVNAGLFACALVVATTTESQIQGAEYLMTYVGEPTPANPTVTPTVTTGPTGSTITVSDAAAHSADWWGNALASVQATALGAAAPTPPSSCGTGGGFGNVPSAFLSVQFFSAGSSTAIPASASGLSISDDCYDGRSLSAPALSGTIVAPASLVSGTTYTAYVCELNLTPLASNDASSTSHCGALSPGESWVDASFTFTAATGTAQAPLSVTSTSGTEGTPVTLASSGGSGTGAVTYVAVNGTASGCTVTSGALSATSAGTCVVTASKAADSTYFAVSSVPTTVTLAALPAPKVTTTKVALPGTAKTLALSMTCGPAACSGTLSATTVVKVASNSKAKAKTQTLSLGSTSFSIAAGSTQSVSLSLSAAAKNYLKANPSHPTLVATVKISGVSGASTVTSRVSLLK